MHVAVALTEYLYHAGMEVQWVHSSFIVCILLQETAVLYLQ